MTDNTAKIVLHWDFMGNVTNYGNKYYIIFLPIIGILLYLVFLHYEKNPFKIHIPNTEKTTKNAKLLIRYIRVVEIVALSILLYITLCSAQFLELQSLLIITTILFIIIYYIYIYKKLVSGNV